MKKAAFFISCGLVIFGATAQAQPTMAPQFLQATGMTPVFSAGERAAFQEALLSAESLQDATTLWNTHRAEQLARFDALGVTPGSGSMPFYGSQAPACATNAYYSGGRGPMNGMGGQCPMR